MNFYRRKEERAINEMAVKEGDLTERKVDKI